MKNGVKKAAEGWEVDDCHKMNGSRAFVDVVELLTIKMGRQVDFIILRASISLIENKGLNPLTCPHRAWRHLCTSFIQMPDIMPYSPFPRCHNLVAANAKGDLECRKAEVMAWKHHITWTADRPAWHSKHRLKLFRSCKLILGVVEEALLKKFIDSKTGEAGSWATTSSESSGARWESASRQPLDAMNVRWRQQRRSHDSIEKTTKTVRKRTRAKITEIEPVRKRTLTRTEKEYQFFDELQQDQ